MLYFFSRLNCRVSTSVVHRLPKPRRRVRLPYPAPHRSKLCIACSDFLQNSERAHAAASPFRKKSRLLRLFVCKRTHDASAALPTFCGFKSSSTFCAGIFLLSVDNIKDVRPVRDVRPLCSLEPPRVEPARVTSPACGTTLKAPRSSL